MAKKVFQPVEVYDMTSKVFIEAPKIDRASELEEEYAGPTSEEIAEKNKKKIKEAEEEAEKIIEDARSEAGKIITEAENGSFDYMKKATEKAKKTDEEAMIDIDKKRIEQEGAFQKKVEEQKKAIKKEHEAAMEKARKDGYDAGYESGKNEVERLIERMHTIVEGAIDKRDNIISDAEIQIIRIILLICRKVVKSISEEQKGIIIENIKDSLEKIKGKTEVIIRVNTEDLELTTEHKDTMMQRFEELKHVTILEDTRVDKGGCIIETDFGSVDARIATQLQDIEDKIRELANLSYFEGTKTVKAVKPKKAEEKKEEKGSQEPEKQIET